MKTNCSNCKKEFDKHPDQLLGFCSKECNQDAVNKYLLKKEEVKLKGNKCTNCSCYYLDNFFVESESKEKIVYSDHPLFCSSNCKKSYSSKKFCLSCGSDYKEQLYNSCELCSSIFSRLNLSYRDYCSDKCRLKAINK